MFFLLFLNYFFLIFLMGAGCEEGPLSAKGRCQQPARLWGVSCQEGSISTSSIPHPSIFLLHFVSISDKGRSMTQTVARISCKHLPAPSKSQDQHTGKTWPHCVIFLAIQPRLTRGGSRHRLVYLPLTGPRSIFWHKQGTPKPGSGAIGKIAVGSLNPAPASLCGASCTEAAICRGRIWMCSLCVLITSISLGWVFFARGQNQKPHKVYSQNPSREKCHMRLLPCHKENQRAKWGKSLLDPKGKTAQPTATLPVPLHGLLERMRQKTSPRAGVCESSACPLLATEIPVLVGKDWTLRWTLLPLLCSAGRVLL